MYTYIFPYPYIYIVRCIYVIKYAHAINTSAHLTVKLYTERIQLTLNRSCTSIKHTSMRVARSRALISQRELSWSSVCQ